MKEPNVWNFVEEYYPNYFSSDEILENDDLHKICDGELNGDAERIYEEEKREVAIWYGHTLDEDDLKTQTLDRFECRRNESDANIFRTAIEEFLRQQSC